VLIPDPVLLQIRIFSLASWTASLPSPQSRVSFETSFDSKQPKLEPKLVSALSETKRLFLLFRFYTETESFDVSIEPKQTKDQPKQFDREHILKFVTENLWFFRFFPVFFRFFSIFFVFFQFFLGFFGLFRNSLFRCFGCFASIPKQRVSIDPKQTEDPSKQFKREYIWVFFRKFRVVSVCFGLLRNSSVCFGCFYIGSKHQNKPKLFAFGFTKQTGTNAKQILFRFVSVCFGSNRKLFCLFRGHPTPEHRVDLEQTFTRGELHQAVEASASSKASGLDGLSNELLFWDMIISL
jgi:hypothetical protein